MAIEENIADVKRKLPRYVAVRKNRGGSVRYYFRRRGYPLTPLPNQPDSTEFQVKYRTVLAHSNGAGDDIIPPERFLDGYRRHWAAYLHKRMVSRAQHQYRIHCNVSTDDIIALFVQQEDRCALSGLEFRYRSVEREFGRDPYAPSVDRIDSQKGYATDNIRAVLLAVNIGLNEWTDTEYRRICRAVARHRQ